MFAALGLGDSVAAGDGRRDLALSAQTGTGTETGWERTGRASGYLSGDPAELCWVNGPWVFVSSIAGVAKAATWNLGITGHPPAPV